MLVVVHSPGGQFPGHLGHAPEQFHIQAFVPEPSVEALDIAILRGPAGADEGELDLVQVGPGVHDLAGELAAVVHRDRDRFIPVQEGPIQGFRHIGAPEPRLGMQGDALPGELVFDGQNPELPPILQPLMDEIHAPALVGPSGQFHDHRPAPGDLLA